MIFEIRNAGTHLKHKIKAIYILRKRKMQDYKYIQVSLETEVALVELNRPEIHNAFDDTLIAELRKVFQEIPKTQARVLILTGSGKSFCAGADLNWMKRMKDYNYDENYRDAYELSEMLKELACIPIPTIAKVNGAAIGGGVGLVAACDMAFASTRAIFSLSEVRLGLVPACISPYLLKKIHPGNLRAYFLTGIRFPADKAKEIGLVNEVVEPLQLDGWVDEAVKNVLSCGPEALKIAKELLEKIPQMNEKESMEYTAKVISEIRISKEGQEGLNAFLEKRKPYWQKKK